MSVQRDKRNIFRYIWLNILICNTDNAIHFILLCHTIIIFFLLRHSLCITQQQFITIFIQFLLNIVNPLCKKRIQYFRYKCRYCIGILCFQTSGIEVHLIPKLFYRSFYFYSVFLTYILSVQHLGNSSNSYPCILCHIFNCYHIQLLIFFTVYCL